MEWRRQTQTTSRTIQSNTGFATVLHQPVRSGDVNSVKSLCDCVKFQGGGLPLQVMLKVAISGDSAAMLKYLFSEGAVIDSALDHIELSDEDRPFEFFQVLVNHGWPIGPRGLSQNLGHGRQVVQLLVEKRGASVDILCIKDAVRTGDVEVVDFLLSKINPRAKVPDVFDLSRALDEPDLWSTPDMNSEAPSRERIINEAALLHLAALYQKLGLVRYLLKSGAAVNYVPDESQAMCGTPLHKALIASRVGKIPDPEVVKVLLDAGADPTIKDSSGRTALQINNTLGDVTTKAAIRSLLLEKIWDSTSVGESKQSEEHESG